MNILVLTPVTDSHKKALELSAPGAEMLYTAIADATDAQVAAADVIFGCVRPEQLPLAANLKLLQLSSAGADQYPSLVGEGVPLCNSTGAYGFAISEHMLAMLFMLKKRLHQYRDNQARSEWRDMGPVTPIEGMTAVVLGMGDIGGTFAKKLKALGAYIIGVRRTDAQKPDYADELVLTGELDSVLPRADVVAMSLPGTKETLHILDARRIAMLKKGAIVLNVGRGTAIDQEALADAVEKGLILAGLDVTDPEPLPPENRLWRLEGALITPHISGYYHLSATHDRVVAIAAENISRLLAGKPLLNRVDAGTGYRADKYGGGWKADK